MNVYSLGSPYGCVPCENLAKGSGGRFLPEPHSKFEEDPIAVWGQLRGAKELLKSSKHFYRLDHAYAGRLKFFRMTKGDFQPAKIVQRPPDRWEALKKQLNLSMKNWTCGRHVLVTLSDPRTYEFFGVEDFPERVVEEIKKFTDRQIRIRPRKSEVPIQEDLANAHCLVTFASNSVIEALLAGIPVFPLGPSIARPVGHSLSEIEALRYFDREEFFRHMAYSQFTNAEFASGFALKTADEQDTYEGANVDLYIRRTPDGD